MWELQETDYLLIELFFNRILRAYIEEIENWTSEFKVRGICERFHYLARYHTHSDDVGKRIRYWFVDWFRIERLEEDLQNVWVAKDSPYKFVQICLGHAKEKNLQYYWYHPIDIESRVDLLRKIVNQKLWLKKI